MLPGLSVLNALIHWFDLTQPYHLFDLYQQPLLGAERSKSAYGLLRPDRSERPAYQQLRAAGE